MQTKEVLYAHYTHSAPVVSDKVPRKQFYIGVMRHLTINVKVIVGKLLFSPHSLQIMP